LEREGEIIIEEGLMPLLNAPVLLTQGKEGLTPLLNTPTLST
jgi:hypothetical protein